MKTKAEQRIAKAAADARGSSGNNGWVTLFRSSNPAAYGTLRIKERYTTYAISLDKGTPRISSTCGLQFASGQCVIMPMTQCEPHADVDDGESQVWLEWHREQ